MHVRTFVPVCATVIVRVCVHAVYVCYMGAARDTLLDSHFFS